VKLALVHGGILVPVKEFYGIFNRHDVVVLRFVDQIDDRRQRRALSAPGWTGNQHDAVLDLGNLHQLLGQVKVFKLWVFAGMTRMTMACVPRCLKIFTRKRQSPGALKERSAEPVFSRLSIADS